MKRHKFTKWNKEKVSIYASAALVVCVCVISGIYAGSQSPSKTQILDIEAVGDEGTANLEEDQLVVNDSWESVPVTNNEYSPIPSAAQSAMEAAQNEDALSEELAADLTGDAEIAEDLYIVNEDEAVPTISVGKNDTALHFNAEEGLSWPVVGNVIMNYSMDERIYFATLNQYCYYPAVAISAEEGGAVASAAEGRVTKTGVNEEIGQYVIVDLGDNYQATYGQLANLTVAQGDTVSKGQIIGYVAAPTKYYSIEGTNVYFKLEQNGTSVNPLLYFR